MGSRRISAFAAAVSLCAACSHSALPPASSSSAPVASAPVPEPVEAPIPEPKFVADDPEPAFPYLDDEPTDKARSIGDTSHGRVAHAAEIVESDALAILPKQKERNLRYGSSAMVNLIDYAAKALFDATQTKLWIGNVGKKGGGDIPYSVSHNAGRDADVAFSYLDARGAPIDAPDLVPLDKDARSKDGRYQLDPKRTWITVRAIATAPDVEVEYVFVSEPLKKKILTWARDHKEKPEDIERAANVMRQPYGSAPHDDHLHVRIYCGELDIASGCIDTGPTTPTKKNFTAARDERVAHALKQLDSKDPVRRASGVLRLGVMRAIEAMPKIVAALNDPTPDVRYAAATVMGTLGGEPEAAALTMRFPIESEDRVRRRILEAVVELGGSAAGDLLARVIAVAHTATGASVPELTSLKLDLLDGGPYLDEPRIDAAYVRTLAVRLAGRAGRMEAVPALIDLLDDRDHFLRTTAIESLSLLTNMRFGDKWEDDDASEAHEKGKLGYLDVQGKLSKSPRDVWIAEGFRRAGFKVKTLDRASVWELVRASADDGFIGMNARTILARIANEAEVAWSVTPGDACTYYLDYFTVRRKRFRLELPPEPVKSACSAARKT